MEIKVTLSLPRDEISIPMIRHVCTHSLRVLGVKSECIDDVEIAISEACSNVLKHARDQAAYEVSAGINNRVAVIEVIDTGGGFLPADDDPLEIAEPDVTSESGRGILLMRALMDTVSFTMIDDGRLHGTRVHLEKRLEWEDGALMGRL